MKSLHHGWGWEPPQAASLIHLTHIESGWASWYAVHGHMEVASNSYTGTTWVIFWGSGSLVESKWCRGIMVDADSHLNHCVSDPYWIYTKFLMLSMGMRQQSQTEKTNTTLLRCWGSGSPVESKWCHCVMVKADSLLKLLPAIHIRHMKSVSTHSYAVHGHMAVALNRYTPTTWLRFWGSGSLV
jgi:hypothetical protein